MKKNMENQTRSELCTDDKNQIILGTLMIFFKSGQSFYQKLYTKVTTSKTATAKLFSTISNRNKTSNK